MTIAITVGRKRGFADELRARVGLAPVTGWYRGADGTTSFATGGGCHLDDPVNFLKTKTSSRGRIRRNHASKFCQYIV